MRFTKSFIANLLSLAVVSLAITGCVSRTDTAIIQQNQIANASSLSSGQKIISKTAMAGQTIQIMSMQSVNPDCTAQDPGILRIVQQPDHGQAAVIQRDAYPNFKPTNSRYVCNKTKLNALVIDYAPAPGFTGSDLMSFEGVFNSGFDTGEVKAIITVK